MFGKFLAVSALHLIGIVLFLKVLGFLIPSVTICYHCGIVGLCFSLVIAYFTFGLTKSKFLNEKVEPGKKAVVITGCDSGFGHKLAKRLDSEGFHVFATCLFPSGPGATGLKESCSDRLRVVELDVTKDGSVKNALQFVESNLGPLELWAVVNNAGILAGFSLEITDMKAFEDSMAVNALGPVRVTKAFLPLLMKFKGRVVTVTSVVGRMVLPFTAPYVMSKFASTAFSDCVRQELDAYGVKVISIEPEIFRTELTNVKKVRKDLDEIFDALKLGNKPSERKVGMLTTKLIGFTLGFFASTKTELVINDLESAVTSKYPSSTYRTRANICSRLLFWVLAILPVELQDLGQKIYLYFVDIFMR